MDPLLDSLKTPRDCLNLALSIFSERYKDAEKDWKLALFIEGLQDKAVALSMPEYRHELEALTFLVRTVTALTVSHEETRKG